MGSEFDMFEPFYRVLVETFVVLQGCHHAGTLAISQVFLQAALLIIGLKFKLKKT